MYNGRAMGTTKTVGLVIPAYNEARGIVRTVDEARAFFRARGYGYDIVVAADGDDGTREAVAALAKTDPGLRVVGGPGRRGKGRGVREGMALVRGDVLGFVDADDKTPISEFAKAEPYLDDGCDVVIGSRTLPDSVIERRQPAYRRLGSRGFAFVMRAMVGLRDITDTQCGFKFFKPAAARELFGLQTVDGYLFDVELLCLAQRAGLRVGEVPVRWRDDGDSRLDVVAGNLKNMRDLWRIRRRMAALGPYSKR